MNSHGSQAAGSGAQDPSNHDVPTDEREPHELVQQPQQSLRTVRAKLSVADAQLPCQVLSAHADYQDDPVEAPSNTDSSGRPRATSSKLHVLGLLMPARI